MKKTEKREKAASIYIKEREREEMWREASKSRQADCKGRKRAFPFKKIFPIYIYISLFIPL